MYLAKGARMTLRNTTLSGNSVATVAASAEGDSDGFSFVTVERAGACGNSRRIPSAVTQLRHRALVTVPWLYLMKTRCRRRGVEHAV